MTDVKTINDTVQIDVEFTEQTTTVSRVSVSKEALVAALGGGPYSEDELTDFVSEQAQYYDDSAAETISFQVTDRMILDAQIREDQ